MHPMQEYRNCVGVSIVIFTPVALGLLKEKFHIIIIGHFPCEIEGIIQFRS